MIAIILAAGKSSRYNGNKLTTKFKHSTLVEWAIVNCFKNEINKVFFTISKDDIKIDDNNLTHDVLQHLNFNIYKNFFKELKIKFQDTSKYGPAAAILPWVDEIDDDFLILFGDNFLYGKFKFPKFKKDITTSIIGSMYREDSKENLRLGYINTKTNKVIEKPHNYTEGNFFTGFCAFSENCKENLKKLKPSFRGEYEITDLINLSEEKIFYDIKDLNWIDLTYKSDDEKIKKHIEKTLNTKKK